MTRRFLTLNGLAVLGVILNHAAGWGYVAMFFWTHRYRQVSVPNFDQLYSPQYFGLRTIEQIIITSIPIFLFVSGFFAAFAAGREKARVEWKFIGQRARYLIIPYLIWSVVMIAADLMLGEQYSTAEILAKIFLGQATPAFYFVPLLIQLYLLSPILVPQAKRHPGRLLSIAAFLQIAAHLIRYAQILHWQLPAHDILDVFAAGWFFPGNIFWFSLGCVISYHHQGILAVVQKFRWAILAATLVLLPAGIWEWEALLRASGDSWITPKETLLDNFFSLGGLMCFIAFSGFKIPLGKKLEDLGSKSFGIYLAHSLVLTLTAKAVYHLAPFILGHQIIFQQLLFVVGLGFPLLAMAVVKRSPLRKLYVYIFG